MTGTANICVQSGVPAALQDLIWAEFFASRGRGISLPVHAPWLINGKDVRSITATDCDGLAGGLVIKDHCTFDQAPVAMIGFVCVHPAKRGRHHSRLLLQSAIENARERGMGGVVLWTKTPQVYRYFGFRNDPRDIFVQFASLGSVQNRRVEKAFTELDGRGLPAFATTAYKLSGTMASVTILTTATGRTVAEWAGPDSEVIDLLSSETAAPVSINALSADSLLIALSGRLGPPVLRMPSARYDLPLNGCHQADLPSIRVLDRI